MTDPPVLETMAVSSVGAKEEERGLDGTRDFPISSALWATTWAMSDDFGEQHVRCDCVDARHRLRELTLRAPGLQLLIRLQVEHLDVGIELLDVREVHAEQEPMMGRKPALESVDDLLPVGVYAVVDQADQHFRVALARDHGFEDGATALTHDVREDGRELDIGAL
jgi:hypothetical protein